MRRTKRTIVAGLAVAVLAGALWGATVFTQDRQLRQVSDVKNLEAGLLSASKRICILAQQGAAIKQQWEADVAAGDLDQASVDELQVKIDAATALVQAATAYRDAHQN